jgi:perosamine synthetase
MGMIKLPTKSIDYFNNNIHDIFNSGNLAEGKWNETLSKYIEDYTQCRKSISVNSNGAGIFSVLNIWKYYKGREFVFLQSNTMYGVKTMALASGLKLIGYVDCKLKYLMPTIDDVKTFIDNLESPEKSVFLITHIGGWINPDIEMIAKYCREKNVLLIEDCAHSLGSKLNGLHSGLFGDAGVYSLYATKAIPAGEGGIVVTNDEELGDTLSKYVIYDRFDQKLDIGINLRMSEVTALLSYSVVREIEFIINNKYEIANKYIRACEEFNWEYICPTDNGHRSNLYKFILLANCEEKMKRFNKIKTRTSSVYNYALGEDHNNISKSHICLPVWYMLEEEIVGKVIEELS